MKKATIRNMTSPNILKRGPVTLWRAGDIAEAKAGADWTVEVKGAGAVGIINAAVVVPTARRGVVTVKEWRQEERGRLVEALRLLVDHLFDRLNLHKVEVRSIDTKINVLSAALQCGFVEEGRRRQCRIADNCWRDRVRMGMLESDWRREMPTARMSFEPRGPEPVRHDLPEIPSPTDEDFAILRGERVAFRRKCPADKEMFYRWLCRHEWWRGWMPENPGGFSPPTREQFEAKWDGRPAAHEWIVETERGIPLGVCFYSGLDRGNRSAEAGILFYEAEHWGRGYGTDAFGVLVKHMFEDLKLHRVHSGTWSGNIGSLGVQQKNGLLIEARGRECYFVDGEWYDGLGTGLLENEYRQNRNGGRL